MMKSVLLFSGAVCAVLVLGEIAFCSKGLPLISVLEVAVVVW